jgi:Werner syndrome ATP-dependent helicase
MSLKEYNKILHKYFGYDSLKPEQYDIIDKLINQKKDVCAILATGFGKSICFQMPYLISKKCVIVISPLIALMEDQLIQMENLDIPVCCLNSTCKNKPSVKKDVLAGNYKLIYITPEYVQNCEEFLVELEEQDGISLIAIDESHCVSTYGNDFRPSYKDLNCLRDWIPKVPILAVTATASDKVRLDIIKYLQLIDPHMIVGNFDRPNLYIRVDKINYSGDKLDSQILELLSKYKKEYIIVYCKTKNNTEKVADKIERLGIKCEAYHAGLSSNKRTEIQQKFVEGEIKCIVATIAFGMGINIPNIRLVIHYGCPKNLESYYQEIGRAGRDGKMSECHLFFSSQDFILNRYFLKEIKDDKYREYQEQQIRNIEKYVYTKECRRKILLNNFGGKIDSCVNCDNCTSIKSKTNSKIDCTYYAYLAISCISKLGTNYGISTLINILRGSNAKNINSYMKKMKEYNSGHDYSSNWWKLLFRDLINDNYILEKSFSKARFGAVIIITKEGIEWYKKLINKYKELEKDTKIEEEYRYYMSVDTSIKVNISEPKDDIELALEIMQENNTEKIKEEIKEENNKINMGKKWTKEEDKKILEDVKKLSIKDIALKYKRTRGGISARLKKLACDMYNESNKSEEEIEKICKKTKISKEILMKTVNQKKLYNKDKEELIEENNTNNEEEDEMIKQMEKELEELEMKEKNKIRITKKK